VILLKTKMLNKVCALLYIFLKGM